MTSRSNLPYHVRAEQHDNKLVKELFRIAEKKKTNLVLSADLTTSEELCKVADGTSQFARYEVYVTLGIKSREHGISRDS